MIAAPEIAHKATRNTMNLCFLEANDIRLPISEQVTNP